MIGGASQLAVECREIVIDRHRCIAQALMGDDQGQRQPELRNIAREFIQQLKQLLVERGQMVLFTPGGVGGHR